VLAGPERLVSGETYPLYSLEWRDGDWWFDGTAMDKTTLETGGITIYSVDHNSAEAFAQVGVTNPEGRPDVEFAILDFNAEKFTPLRVERDIEFPYSTSSAIYRNGTILLADTEIILTLRRSPTSGEWEETNVISRSETPVVDFTLSPDGRILYMLGTRNTLFVVDTIDGTQSTIEIPSFDHIVGLIDNQRIVLANDEQYTIQGISRADYRLCDRLSEGFSEEERRQFELEPTPICDEFGASTPPLPDAPTATLPSAPAIEIPGVDSASDTSQATTTRQARIVTGDRVNIREGDSTDFDVVATIEPTTVLEVIGANNDESWYNVRLPDGRTGWVAAFLIEIVEP
jgi:hypothetical protein